MILLLFYDFKKGSVNDTTTEKFPFPLQNFINLPIIEPDQLICFNMFLYALRYVDRSTKAPECMEVSHCSG
jgi:hypothetical protein